MIDLRSDKVTKPSRQYKKNPPVIFITGGFFAKDFSKIYGASRSASEADNRL